MHTTRTQEKVGSGFGFPRRQLSIVGPIWLVLFLQYLHNEISTGDAVHTNESEKQMKMAILMKREREVEALGKDNEKGKNNKQKTKIENKIRQEKEIKK